MRKIEHVNSGILGGRQADYLWSACCPIFAVCVKILPIRGAAAIRTNACFV